MSDIRSTHEFNDELLSAYLDGELSEAERAAVDARLAEDAAAREMLHQLRSVSQALQGLPQEPVGRDLGEAVLQRVNRRNGDGGTASMTETIDGSIPKLTIGRSRRGWIWASLAVAAALLIMARQPGRDADDDLPAVAQKKESADSTASAVGRERGRRGELVMRSLSEPAADSPPSDMREIAPAEPAARPERALAINQQESNPPDEAKATDDDSQLDRIPQPNGEAVVAQGRAAVDRSGPEVAGPPAAGSLATTDSPMAPPAAAPRSNTLADSADAYGMNRDTNLGTQATGEPMAPAEQTPPVVVRVLARREALQTKAFERLLESQGIQVESEFGEAPTSATTSDAAQRRPQNLAIAAGDELSTQSSNQVEPEAELVFVDAPVSMVTSSLETIANDVVNFPALAVGESDTSQVLLRDDVAAAAGRSRAEPVAQRDKQQVERTWSQYNRGVVPETPAALSQNSAWYYQNESEALDRFAPDSGARGGFGGRGAVRFRQQAPPTQQEVTSQVKDGMARALRLRSWQTQSQSDAKQTAPGEAIATGPVNAQQLGELQRNLRGQSQSGGDRVQVLFVISPAEAAASSPPARNKAQ